MGPAPRNSTAVEDYLKAVFNLAEWDDAPIAVADLAARLGVSTASSSEMVRKLADRGLVEHERYGGVSLTDAGREQALGMVRRHRLLETYLVERLGYSWDEVHDEAEVLEHAVSALLLERLDVALGHPWRDPHGDPIPTADGVLHQPVSRPLPALAPGESGVVARIDDDDPELLRWLADQGVVLDVALAVVEQRPFGGPLVVEVGVGEPLDLGIQAQHALWIAADRPRGDASPGECPYLACRHR